MARRSPRPTQLPRIQLLPHPAPLPRFAPLLFRRGLTPPAPLFWRGLLLFSEMLLRVWRGLALMFIVPTMLLGIIR